MMKSRLPRLTAVGAALVIGLFASAVEAQGRPQGDDRGGRRGERFDPAQMLDRRVSFLTEQLQLSSSQQTQVRSILSEEMNAMQALRPQGGRDGRGPGAVRRDSARSRDDARRGERSPELDARRDSARAQMQQIRQRTEQRLASVLNAQQQTKYRELQTQMDDRRGRGRGGDDRPRAERRGD
jgi:hypothetical protein